MIAEDVDVMFITSTSFLIQSKDGRVVILCYRGTPPTSAITWLTDIEVDPVKSQTMLPETEEHPAASVRTDKPIIITPFD